MIFLSFGNFIITKITFLIMKPVCIQLNAPSPFLSSLRWIRPLSGHVSLCIV